MRASVDHAIERPLDRDLGVLLVGGVKRMVRGHGHRDQQKAEDRNDERPRAPDSYNQRLRSGSALLRSTAHLSPLSDPAGVVFIIALKIRASGRRSDFRESSGWRGPSPLPREPRAGL